MYEHLGAVGIKGHTEDEVMEALINGDVNSSISGIRITKAFNNAQKEIEKFDAGLGELMKSLRTDDLLLLLAIRRGDYMQADGTFSQAFYEILEEYERKLDEAAAKTTLPDNPDMDKVEKFVERINRIAIAET